MTDPFALWIVAALAFNLYRERAELTKTERQAALIAHWLCVCSAGVHLLIRII